LINIPNDFHDYVLELRKELTVAPDNFIPKPRYTVTKEQKRRYYLTWKSDPERYARTLARKRHYRKIHAKEIFVKIKKRYHSDPVFAEKIRERSRRWYSKHKSKNAG
jgi:hypothetical protein